MIYKKNTLLLFLFSAFLLLSGCSKDDNPADSSPLPNESEVLAQYLESNGDYVNILAPALVTAKDIREAQLNNADQVILDIRTVCDYRTKGHIDGAVLINLKDIPKYYDENNLQSKKRVIITCTSGQSGSFAASLLRMYGYKNIYSMMWGMTSWNPEFDYWSGSVSDSRAASFETTAHVKNNPGSLPHIETGETSPQEILKDRAKGLMISGFDDSEVSNETVFLNLNSYYIVSYTGTESYTAGHIPNAVQYSPAQDIKLSTYLKTLPTDRIIAVYCATGHTSAYIVAYLKLLGYKAKSVLYGNNGMNYSTMVGKKFSSEEINNFPYVR